MNKDAIAHLEGVYKEVSIYEAKSVTCLGIPASRCSSVRIITGYELEERCSIPGRGKEF
jgi:hypothetical protein